jgi:hypothetical protein
MNINWIRKRMNRGTVFDLGIFLANCWLVPQITMLARDFDDTGSGHINNVYYAAALFASILLYTLGAALKKKPQCARLTESPDDDAHNMWAKVSLFILMIMQFALYMMTFMIGLAAIKTACPNCGWIPKEESIITMLLALTAGTIPVVFTLRALMPSRQPVEPAPRLRSQERFADTALCFSAIVSLSIWDGIFMRSLEGTGPHAWYLSILLVVLITVPFSIFYAAPRVLLLREDYRRPMTWVRIAAVMLPLTTRLMTL